MDKQICIDTDVAIAILNNEERAQKVIDKIENMDIFISAINLFELLLRETNLEQIEIFRNKVNLLEFDEASARKASLIHKELKNKGELIDFKDLFIAATCIVNNYDLMTFNKKHFERLEKFGLVLV